MYISIDNKRTILLLNYMFTKIREKINLKAPDLMKKVKISNIMKIN